jgi:ribulose-5-phosphate 4-epimerase/fuculose-1-phosphate aldolase
MSSRFVWIAGAVVLPAALFSFVHRSTAQTLQTPPPSGTLATGGNLRNPPQPKAEVVTKVELTNLPNPAQIDELVLANHILATEDVLGAYGHISVRDQRNPDHYLLSQHIPPELVTAADIVEYDMDSNPARETKLVGYSERFIHGQIYKARPDVKAIIHFHAPELLPFGATGVPLRPMTHMAGFLPAVVPIFEIRKFGFKDMLVKDNDMGRALAKTLGNKPTALMRGHGAVVVADSVHVVAGRAYYMMINAKVQMQAMAMATGGRKVTYFTPEEAATSANQDGFERAWMLWAAKQKNR